MADSYVGYSPADRTSIPNAAVGNAQLAASAITGQSALGTTPANADVLLLYDDSASVLKKVTYANFGGDIAGVTAGTGLNGGGTGGTVTVNLDTTLPNNTVISTSGAITTTGAFTSIGIDDNADALAVTITAAEKVGIGVTDPDEVLEVNGAIHSGNRIDIYKGGNVTKSGTMGANDDIGLTGMSANDFSIKTVEATSAFGIATSGASDVDFYISDTGNVGIGSGVTAADKLTVTGDGAISGSLGIGKTGPTALLDILGGSGADVGINIKSSGGAGNGARLTTNAGDDGQLALIQSTGTGIVLLVGDASTENYIKSTLNMYDNVIQRPIVKDYGESYTASSGTGTVGLDLTAGNVFQHTASGGNVTFEFNNPTGAANTSCAFTLKWIQDSSDRTATWPASVDWAAATAPTLTSGSGKVDVFTFFTVDAGTTWYGFTAGQDMS